MAPSTEEIMDRRLDGAETDIKLLTRNVTILTKDVQAMLKSQEEISALVREQAIQSRDIKQATELAQFALQRHDELNTVVSTLVTKVEISNAVESARIGMLQALLKYWPIWTSIAAAGVFGGYFISHTKLAG